MSNQIETTNSLKRTFKITIQNISNEYKLQCSIINNSNNENKEETKIKIQDKEEYSLQFTLDENNIDFMNDLINKPEEYKIYSIHYFKKEYLVVAEVLFALILDEIVQKVKKEYILEETIIVELPINFESEILRERINVVLDAIGMKGIEIGEEITYDYSEQGKILNEILEKKETIEKRIKIVDKVNEYAKKMGMEEIQMNDSQMESTEDNFELELSKKFTFEQRKAMNLSSLDNYCIFIASRHFESLDDHINLMFVSKRMQGNMEKFHYNPISVDTNSVEFFPNIESLYIYKEDDEYLEGGRIQRYVNWYGKVRYHELEEIKRKYKGKEIECKNIIYTIEDRKIDEKLMDNNHYNVPYGVKEIGDDCFKYCHNLKEIIIPNTVTKIGKKCFSNCYYLTKIELNEG